MARVVIPGLPHHITQRGNHREPAFFSDDDYRAYLDLICKAARAAGTEVWANCLTPNPGRAEAEPMSAEEIGWGTRTRT